MCMKLNKTTLRVIEIFEILSENYSLSQADLQRRMKIPKSSLHELLQTLLSANAIVFSDHSKKLYRISPRMQQMFSTSISQQNVITLIHPFLVELSKKFNACSYFAVLTGDRLTYAIKVESENPIRVIQNVGTKNHLHSSGLGKSILACMKSDDVKNILGTTFVRKTENTITLIDDLLVELKQTRERGFAIDNCEDMENIVCVAAPIRRSHNELIGAISLPDLQGNLSAEEIASRGNEIQLIAHKISRDLGFTSNNLYSPMED